MRSHSAASFLEYDDMTEYDITDFVTRFAAAWATRDGARFLELWHPDGTLHSPLYDRPIKGSEFGA